MAQSTGFRVFRELGEAEYQNVDGRGAPALSAEAAMVRVLEELVERPELDRLLVVEEFDSIPDWSDPMEIRATDVFDEFFLAWRAELAAGLSELGEERRRARRPLAARRWDPEPEVDRGSDELVDEYPI